MAPPAAPVADAPEPAADPAVDPAAGAAPIQDEVDEDALVLLAEGDPEDGEAPLSVKFMVESLLDDAMNGPQYKWDFGDGSPVSTEASPTHVYEKPGSYTATIRIVDAAGQLGWDEVDIEVDEP
jgi:PKD repeat protein